MYSENLQYIESLIKSHQSKSNNTLPDDWLTLIQGEPQPQSTHIDNITNNQSNFNHHQLVDHYRQYGHLNANTSPIANKPSPYAHWFLEKLATQLNHNQQSIHHNFKHLQSPCSLDVLSKHLESLYCQHTGAEIFHIQNPEEKKWLIDRYESTKLNEQISASAQKGLIQYLTQAEELEKYLHKKFVGQKRFSLEGCETLTPMIFEALNYLANQHNTKKVVLGMSHRGRVNILMNIFGKLPEELFAEFNHTKKTDTLVGDVKYHLGRSAVLNFGEKNIHASLLFNPSHLAIVTPITTGKAAAIKQQNGYNDQDVTPIVIHGDSAFCGQGVIMETFSFSQTKGYRCGGTIHIVVNNQLGFTTDKKEETRSSIYCTDIAKMVDVPVFHVNATDPEAALHVMKIAIDYRMKFQKDVVIDLMGWRKYGHNEADDPKPTQPVMYQTIKGQKSIAQQYADKLCEGKFFTPQAHQKMRLAFIQKLDNNQCLQDQLVQPQTNIKNKWLAYKQQPTNIKTGVPKATIQTINQTINQLPPHINIHPQIKKIYESRLNMLNDQAPIDWGCAENMAYATLIEEGFSVRISGQDSIRGTFAHRHAGIFDQKTGESFFPIHQVTKKPDHFQVINSTLSELGVSGFEYGYSIEDPNTLVIWEAQFGDFANGAQIMIDQFISSAHAKWNLLSGLVMLLPHGHEGQGAEHSSARPERFLQLCGMKNIQVCYPSNASQIFHLLRRQMLRKYRRPLIILSPKSLLRKKQACVQLSDLTDGQFENIIVSKPEKSAKKVILCTGKIFYEIQSALKQNNIKNIALIRIEQLYPLPKQELQTIDKKYPNIPVTWCQEEPKNQGFWWYLMEDLNTIFEINISYVGRETSAVTACGSLLTHKKEQALIINTVIKV